MANLGAGAEALLEASYDCLDRGVFNAYFQLGHTPGGFRAWWRALFGSDDDLDDAHLMRLAGRFARRAEAWANKANVPFVRCEKGERKHELAHEYLPTDPNFQGVFCVLVGRAPASIWQVQRYGNGGINLKRKDAFVNHYSFHIMDREWGHITIKICGHAPFFAQIMINGHEFVARELSKQGIEFTQEENCFTETSNAAELSRCAETSCHAGTIGRLRQLCERWIYSACLCFALSEEERQRSGFRYDYSWYQAEYSRNLLFAGGARMEEFIQDLIDRVRQRLDLRTLKTLFGRKQRPQTRCRKRLEQSLERPVYDLTVFKVHWGRLTLKVYTKGERLTRLEAIVHNTKELKCRRSLENGAEILSQLRGMLDRFCETLESVSRPWVSDSALEQLPEATRVGERSIAGIDLNRARMRAVVESVLALATRPGGFQTEHLAERVSERLHAPYSSRQASYDLKKLRAKGLVEKQPQSRRYVVNRDQLRPLTALLVLREHVLRPVIARSNRSPSNPPSSQSQTRIDQHYDRLQLEMESLFQTLQLTP